MLLVRTYLDKSKIAGLGLFAAEDIPKGTIIWRLERTIDLILSPEQIECLHPAAREQIKKYCYIQKKKLVLCADDSRFMNHDPINPSCTETGYTFEDKTIAARDIKAGEELTCDYTKFDQVEDNLDWDKETLEYEFKVGSAVEYNGRHGRIIGREVKWSKKKLKWVEVENCWRVQFKHANDQNKVIILTLESKDLIPLKLLD